MIRLLSQGEALADLKENLRDAYSLVQEDQQPPLELQSRRMKSRSRGLNRKEFVRELERHLRYEAGKSARVASSERTALTKGESTLGRFQRFVPILVLLLPSCGGDARQTEGTAKPAISTPAAQPLALIEAAKEGNLEEVRRLLDEGADPNATTDFQEFALMGAVSNDRPDVVALLLDRGASPNLRDMHGQTALFMAAYERNPQVVTMLLDAGAEVDVVTNAGETALLRSVIWQDRDTVDLLLKAGAKPETVTEVVLVGVGFKNRAEW